MKTSHIGDMCVAFQDNLGGARFQYESCFNFAYMNLKNQQ